MACPDNKVSDKANHVCTANQMLEGGFVAKTSILKPKPSLLYLGVHINQGIVSYLVETSARHSFMSSKFAKELGLLMRRAGKPINVRFAKCEPHETKELALHVTLK